MKRVKTASEINAILKSKIGDNFRGSSTSFDIPNSFGANEIWCMEGSDGYSSIRLGYRKPEQVTFSVPHNYASMKATQKREVMAIIEKVYNINIADE